MMQPTAASPECDLLAREARREAVISLRDVAFGYETGLAVVRGISAAVAPGRLTALIGPNASGKTTLLRLILGQLTPWGGSITLGGRQVDQMRPRERARRISYVPQRSSVRFAFTVEQVVRMARYLIGDDESAVAAALDACDLAPHRGRVFSTLSAGQQQGVLLARAMAQARGGGTLMLLDEPVSAMDLGHQHATMRRLRDLAGGGLAVVVVLHDLNLAARYAQDVWLMNAGRLIAAGRWREVLIPGVLEPVYGVRIAVHRREGHDRPMFFVDPPATLSDEGARP